MTASSNRPNLKISDALARLASIPEHTSKETTDEGMEEGKAKQAEIKFADTEKVVEFKGVEERAEWNGGGARKNGEAGGQADTGTCRPEYPERKKMRLS